MSWLDRVSDVLENRTGIVVQSRERVGKLREDLQRLGTLAAEGVELAWQATDYSTGRPEELRPEKRRRLAQRSRLALHRDPLAGAQADLLANFGIGRGIPMATAKDEAVQQAIKEAWEDTNNQAKLTSFEAQRHRSNQLLTDANAFPCFYVSGGRLRVGFLDTELVDNVVMDPEDDERVLWYVVRRRKSKWDFTQDREDIAPATFDGGLQRVFYYAHWRNLADARREREMDPTMEPVPEPPESKKAVGLVYHWRINRIGRSQWGTPPWARQLRFFSAMNMLTESHVAMAQAASSLVAKRSVDTTDSQLAKAANAVLSQAGELGSVSFHDPAGAGTEPPHGAMPPGSVWTENTASKLESLSLQSGAGQMLQTSQIVRAPIAASSGFGQHYLGDLSSANLAGATTLELPTLMNVQAWQQTQVELLDAFTLMAVQAAVQSGRLGGGARPPDSMVPLDQLQLSEREHLEEAERRTGKEIKWVIELPYPGRRNLPDVTQTFLSVLGVSGLSANKAMLRRMLLFLFQQGMQIEDAADAVDEVMSEQEGLIQQMLSGIAAGGAPAAPGGSQQVEQNPIPSDQQSKQGERRRSSRPEDSGGAMEVELQALAEAAAAAYVRAGGAPLQLPAGG